MLLDAQSDARTVLVDASSGLTVTVGDVRGRARELAWARRRLCFLFVDGSMDSYAWFLSLVEAGVPVALLDARLSTEDSAALVARYDPELIVDPGLSQLAYLRDGQARPEVSRPGATSWQRGSTSEPAHPELSVLLTTSGSTGSPRFVRLSRTNISANAGQIVQSLGITDSDVGVTSLPLFYSFGMSIVTSHASVGSRVVVTRHSIIEEEFWRAATSNGVSYLAGVPTTYAMLKRLGFERRDLPSLTTLIQAGGRLAPELVTFFHDVMRARGARFLVMYGQTEAGPRIACLPDGALPEKLGSAGLAMAGGELTIRGSNGEPLPPGEVGEVIYEGPNVMMGYAETRADLALGDTFGSTLATGDLGFLDNERFLFLTGRTKRIAKLAGARVSLDEVEALAAQLLGGEVPVAVVGSSSGDGIAVFVVTHESDVAMNLRRRISRRLQVAPGLVVVHETEELPLLPNGKMDYERLAGRSVAGDGTDDRT